MTLQTTPVPLSAEDALAFVQRVLRVYFDADQHGDLFWRVDNEQVRFFAMCNDTFWWATADLEEITPDNVSLLEQTLMDLRSLPDRPIAAGVAALQADFSLLYLSELFAARSRKMRPQRPCYEKMSAEIAALFDACGPVRDRKDEG